MSKAQQFPKSAIDSGMPSMKIQIDVEKGKKDNLKAWDLVYLMVWLWVISGPFASLIYLTYKEIIHVYDCPANNGIPIYVIVAGIFLSLRVILDTWFYLSLKSVSIVAKFMWYRGFIMIVLKFWMILGAIWFFGIDPDFDNAASLNYCHPMTYVKAFTYIIFTFVLQLTDWCTNILVSKRFRQFGNPNPVDV